MRNFIQELRENTGYYYTDEKINIKDFTILCAFIITLISLTFVWNSHKDSFYPDTFIVITTPFYVPYIIYFLIKLYKMIKFKIVKKIILTHGQEYSAKITSSVEGKRLFYEPITLTEKFSYYPVITYYDTGKYKNLTSSFAVNNSHFLGLASDKVTIYIYKDKFIINEYSTANSADESLYHKKNHSYKTFNKLKVNIALILLGSILLSLILKLLLPPILNNIIK